MKGYGRPAAGDHSRDRLIAEHAEMARRIALRIARRAPTSISPDDLVGAAHVGLTEACDRYDPDRGEPFVAFAEKRIRGAVLDELRRGDPLSRRDRWAARRVGAALRVLEMRLGRPPEDEEVAAELGVSIEEYRNDLEELPRLSFVSLGDNEVGADAGPGPESQLSRIEAIARVRAALDRLPARDAQLLSLYYVEEFSYAEIGEVLGVSESRICQLHARALARLRVELDDEDAGTAIAAAAPPPKKPAALRAGR